MGRIGRIEGGYDRPIVPPYEKKESGTPPVKKVEKIGDKKPKLKSDTFELSTETTDALGDKEKKEN